MFSILHISDLHRTPNARISNAELLSALLSDRDAYTRGDSAIRAPDAVVVSGDVVQGVPLKAGNSHPTLQDQYEEAEAFLSDLADEFVTGDRSKVILVPGNHDIDWQVAKSAMQLVEVGDLPEDVLKALQEPDSLFRFSWKTREVFRIVDQARYETRLDAFWKFFDSFYRGRTDLLRVYVELNPTFLWGSDDSWPRAMTFCVVEWSSLRRLHCPAAWPDAAMRDRPRDDAVAERQPIAWEDDSIPQRSVTWGLFMNAEFGVGDWIVVATQAESELLRPAVAFNDIFLSVAAFALLIVIWMSLRLIRSTLTPLEQLTQATRRVAAHDFEARLEVTRQDEFGELACAFNAMSARLGQQFRSLNAMAEIDREILSSRDLERVSVTALRHLHLLVRARTVGVMLLEQHNRSLARIWFTDDQRATEPVMVRSTVSPDDAALFRQDGHGIWISSTDGYPDCLTDVLAATVSDAFICPIEWRDTLCGSLILGVDSRQSLAEGERSQVCEAAARLAVAVSSSWRDAQLHRQAHYDALTGLPNRPLFLDRLSQEIMRCSRETTSFGLVFIDLDHFKKVNDTQGHSRGDAVLCEAAARLVRCVRESDTVARLGGDEFAIVMAHGSTRIEVTRVVQQVLSSLALPFAIDGQQSYLGASLGIAVFPTDGTCAEELLKNADTAMYRAKANGRGQAVFFQEAMNREARERVFLEQELHAAIDRGQFILHYQPQMGIECGKIVGAEALIRWQHPERGLISPAQFIPVAEESNLIEQVGAWALRTACTQLRSACRAGIALNRIAVNVSVRQLYDPHFFDTVRDALAETDCPAHLLELEITESVLAERRTEVREVLDRLRALGVALSLDDFGTGYASLAYLRDLPVSVVKIDRSFIMGLPGSDQSVAIVRATIAMAHSLGKKVVAEGVETMAQLVVLRELGCDVAQGYLVSRPLPAIQFERFMRAGRYAGRENRVEDLALA